MCLLFVMPLKRDKEEVVESRASHILESAIRLMTYIRENFDQDTAFKLEKKFTPIYFQRNNYYINIHPVYKLNHLQFVITDVSSVLKLTLHSIIKNLVIWVLCS